jgi:SAM-dependent methyltransferase
MKLDVVFVYTAPPEGETKFPSLMGGGGYNREVVCCRVCGHFLSLTTMYMETLYRGEYVDSTYSDRDIQSTFERIISLPPERSDNAGRVRRVLDFAANHFTAAGTAPYRLSVLDVGSGLCVFLHRMKMAGWECTALEPDPRMGRHARDIVGVNVIPGDFREVQDIGLFDVITFNKVLEHIKDPISALRMASEHLREGGFVYLEVPDGETATKSGPGREEFFIEHLHVFSMASLSLLIALAGYSGYSIERLKESSGKFTLCAFIGVGS